MALLKETDMKRMIGMKRMADLESDRMVESKRVIQASTGVPESATFFVALKLEMGIQSWSRLNSGEEIEFPTPHFRTVTACENRYVKYNVSDT